MNNVSSLQSSAATEFLIGLADRGVKHIFGNAGTDFAPVLEAISVAKDRGYSIPNIITVVGRKNSIGVC